MTGGTLERILPPDDISSGDIFALHWCERVVDPEIAAFGRFAEPALLILISLAGGEKHGYAIMLDIEDTCGVRVGPGTLYAALSRLETRRLVEGLPSDDRRRPYRLTPDGATALRTQLASIERLASTGLRRLANEQ